MIRELLNQQDSLSCSLFKGLVSGYIGDHYNTQKMSIICGLVCTLSLAVAYVAPNLEVTILAFTVLGRS